MLGLLEAYWDAYDAVELSTYADYSYLTEVWDYHPADRRCLSRQDYTAGKEALIQHMRLIDKLGVAHELCNQPTTTDNFKEKQYEHCQGPPTSAQTAGR